MDIYVTTHAVKRYRERMFDYISSDEKIANLLKNAAQRGKQVYVRPSNRGYCIELKYKGISVVVVHECARATVITCLGDSIYRNWVKKKENQNIYGRLLYPESGDLNVILHQPMSAVIE